MINVTYSIVDMKKETYKKGGKKMSLIQVNCKNCGANMQVDDAKEKTFCSSCGTQYLYERPVSVHIENINLGSLPTPQKQSTFSFNMQEYASPFVKTEAEVKHDWLNILLSFDDAPLDVAYKSKIVSVSKEYHPVAFFKVTCTADWNAISYWEHDEPYQVVEKHRTLSGEVEHRVVTKYNKIVDAVQQTNGIVPPTTHYAKVWMGANPESAYSLEFISWIDVDTECLEIKDGYLQEFSIFPVCRERDEAINLAEQNAHNEMCFLAEDYVPGDRFENLNVRSSVENDEMTMRYVAVYHVIYEYDGNKYSYCSPGIHCEKKWLDGHPIDVSIQKRVNQLQAKVDSIKKWPWILALIFSPIPLVLFGLIISFAARSEATIALTWIFIFLIYVFFIAMLIVSIIRKANATSNLNSYKEKNDSIKRQIHGLINDNSMSDEIKSATIEKWVSETLL